MYIVGSYTLAVIFCFVTMLCWGSWGNTQKLAAKSWRYELFYWDYVIGMVIFSLILAFTAGSIGSQGRPFLQDLAQVSWTSIGWVVLGAVVFNVSNILLSASVSLAGMAVAFPLGVGIALVMGVLNNLLLHPTAGQNTTLLWIGVALVVLAIICNGIASGYSAYRAFGDRGAAEWGAHTDRKIRLHFSSWNCPEGVPETQFYDPAESVCRTDPDVAKGLSAGHGGSDYLVVRKVVAFLRDGVMPYFDVYRAAAISATAALALKSCLANGEMYRIPDFRCAEEMKEVENDDLTPFYDDEGHGGTIRPSLEYTPEQFDKVGVFNG